MLVVASGRALAMVGVGTAATVLGSVGLVAGAGVLASGIALLVHRPRARALRSAVTASRSSVGVTLRGRF